MTAFARAITNWRPRPPFYYGWLVLGTAALGTFAATGVAQIVLGGIQNLIFEDMGWDRATIAYAVTIGTLASGFLTPFVGRLVDRYGPRGLVPFGALVVGVSLFGIAGTSAVWHFYLAYIVGRAIANPTLTGVVPRTVAVNFFRRKRNLALGLSLMARPVGGSINIQAISFVAQARGWRFAYRALGAFSLVLAVPLFLVMRRRPEDIGLRPDGDTGPRPVGDSATRTPREGVREFEWRAGEAVLTSTFWLILTAAALVILTDGAMTFQVVPYLKDVGLSQTLAAGALSVGTLLGALAIPPMGYLADRFDPRSLALVALPTTGLVSVLFLVSDSGDVGFVVFIVWGTVSGGAHILTTMMMAQYFGRASFGSITGLMGPVQMGALGIGPTFGAVLYSLTTGYTAFFVYAVAGYAVAALLILGTRPPRLPRRALAENRPSEA